MCRNIHTLHNFEPAATDAEVQAAALQYVRKIAGTTKPSKANQAVFDRAVADIAHATSLSRAQLYRLFASQDKSVHATLREERLAKSMSYLKQPESGRLSIGAIAYACGFSDQSVFSKLFRQRFDMTPREARAGALVSA